MLLISNDQGIFNDPPGKEVISDFDSDPTETGSPPQAPDG